MRVMRGSGTALARRRKRKLPAALLACLLATGQVQSAFGEIVNNVTVRGNYGGVTVTTTATAAVKVTISSPRISLLKTGTYNDGGDGKPDVGDTIAYRFNVENTGNVSLRNVTVSDPLVTVNGGPLTVLDPGLTDSTTFTAVYSLTQADIDAGNVTNTASVSAVDPANVAVSAVDGETTALVATSGLTLAKAGVLNDGGDGRADAGDTILYQLVVTNTGPTTLSNVRITDPLLDLAGRASAARALARFDGLLTDTDPMMTASAGEGLRSTIIDETQHPETAGNMPSAEEKARNATDLPLVALAVRGSRRLVQFTGTPGKPRAGDRVGILYSITNSGEAPVFDLRLTEPGSEVFNHRLDQLNPGETDTGSILFTRRLTAEELKAGHVLSSGTLSAVARNTDLSVAFVEPLALAGLEHADMLETATITPAAVATLASGDQTVFTATYTLTQADIDAGGVNNTAVASGLDPGGATLTSVDSATVPLTSRPGIALLKTGSADLGSDSTATAGDVITYSFTVINTGNVTLNNVIVTDPLIAVSGGPIPSLLPGASDQTTFTASYAITQADINAGQVVNQATASGSPPTGIPVTDLSSSTNPAGNDQTVTSLSPTSAISLVKTLAQIADLNGNGLTDLGDQLNYVFTVSNTGNVTLTNIMVTDPLATVTGGPLPSLLPGQSDNTVFRASHVLTQADIDAGEFENQALASATDPAGASVQDQSDGASATGNNPTMTMIPEAPSITLIKGVSSVTDSNGNGVNDAGDIINYRFTVANTGNVTLSAVTVQDPLVSVSGGPLATLAPAAIDTATFTARYTITAADALAGRVTNQATVSAMTPAGRNVSDLSDNVSPDENDPTITAVTILPAIALLKIVDAITDTNGNALTDAGDTIDYRFSVVNTGNVALTNVSITDPLVTVTGGPIATLDAGDTDSTTFQASYVITAADVAAGRVTNQATVFGTGPLGAAVSDLSDGENQSENDPTVTLLSSTPGIALVKSVASVNDVNGNGLTDAGDSISYAFAVTNTGNAALNNVTIIDPKVAVNGGPLAFLGVSQTDRTTFTATYVIAQADVDAGGVSNQAIASAVTSGNVRVTDRSDESSINGDDQTFTPINQTPGIALIKSVSAVTDVNGNGQTDAGDSIAYDFAVTNTGNQSLQNVTVADPLVAVTGGPLASLAAGATDATTFTARYIVTVSDMVAGSVRNQATVSAATSGGTGVSDISDDNSLTESDPTVTPVVQTVPQLSKTALHPDVRRGERVPFVIVASNSGSGPLHIVDKLPPGFSYVRGSATVNGRNVRPVADGRSLRFENLRPDASGTISLKLTLLASTTLMTGRHINRAELLEPAGTVLATAQAAVNIVEEHVFDCGEVIGRVFDDKNRNGYADDGEPGLPGVRVATVKGLLVTTDKHGRFHVPCADIPDARTGSNFLMKLDTRTLPSGYAMTSENPRDVRLTRGKITKLNFAASILREVMLELEDEAFAHGKPALSAEWHKGIAHLMQVLEQEPSVLKVTYSHRDAKGALAKQRLSAVRALIANEWQRRDGDYRLVIDTRAVGPE